MTLAVRQDCTGHGGKPRDKMYPQLAGSVHEPDIRSAKYHGRETPYNQGIYNDATPILVRCKTLPPAPSGAGCAVFQNNIMLTQQIADTVGLYPIFVFARAIALRYQLLNGIVAVNSLANTLSG